VATARASLAEARAQLSQAEKAVEDVVVLAPFSGYISARNVSLGEYVQPSTPVVRLLKIDPMRLQLTIPAVQAGQVALGQRVSAQVDAFPGRRFEGQITAINPAISPESRAFAVEARVPNPDAALKPGMFAVATIDQGRTERAMLVPRRAVVEDVNTNSFRVFVIDGDNRARLRVVQLAARQQGDRVRIVAGVAEGERVATSNLADLYDGAAVAPSTRRYFIATTSMQKLAEICVRRPVFATMLIAAITVVGAVSVFQLGVDRYPRIEMPVVSVTTSNRGATPENIETEVTDRIEAAVNTVAGIDELRSTSSEGSSRVNITFDLSKNPDVAAQEVRAKVDPVIRNLPDTADPPVVQKQDPDATPIMLFSISSGMPAVELTTYVEQNIQKRIESVNGVGEVILYGARRREIHVKIDPDRLNGYGLTTTDVAAALRAQNLELPGGSLEQGERELSVRTVGRLQRPQDFEDLVVATRGNMPIRISDIGTVEDTGAVPRSVSMLNGKPAVTVAIRKQSGVNTVALADALRARMAEIQATLPPNFEVRLVRDDSEFIRASLHAIQEHLILGGIFAAIIVFVFLRSFRSTIIAGLAIPTSIIGAFGFMALFGFTLNQMTMLALTLMVGIVIDDAIVVLENIYRFVEEKGMTAVPGGDRRDEGDRPGGHGDDDVAAGGVHSCRVPRRDRRAVHVVVRPDGGGRDLPSA
jgi:hypothetical protein